MKFADQPPSRQWAALKYRGEKFAEVWFKPDGDPLALVFRIPQASFHIPGMAAHLTIEHLLKIVAISTDEMASWKAVDHSVDGDPRIPLAPPPADVPHLEVRVHVKPPTAEAGSADDMALMKWQDLQARWKTILSLEANMDGARVGMETLLTDMEASLTKTLTIEEKNHALRADVAQWNKAKNRVRFALPKMREFIHRAIWSIGSPERKQLEGLYKSHIQPQIPFPNSNRVLEQLENLQKDRQVLSAQGITVSQESRTIFNEVQSSLRTLQSNAAANGLKKKNARGPKGQFMKTLRKASGADG